MATADVKHDSFGDEKKIEDIADKSSNSDAELGATDIQYDDKEAARVLAKVDHRLVPILALLYLIAFIDRSNSMCILSHSTMSAGDGANISILTVGNAKIAGMTDDLNMHGLQYNTAVTLFFVPYTLLEVPSNIILKMMKPSYWMAILMFSWGLVSTYSTLQNRPIRTRAMEHETLALHFPRSM